jgi:hypothetical protein
MPVIRPQGRIAFGFELKYGSLFAEKYRARGRRFGRKVKCFVIMPFDKEFYDVYKSIRTAVERAAGDSGLVCIRLAR